MAAISLPHRIAMLFKLNNIRKNGHNSNALYNYKVCGCVCDQSVINLADIN